MFPHVGLYLPDSLYPNQSTDTTGCNESQPVKFKYFERRSMALNHDSDNRKSVALSRKSPEDVTRIFSSLSTVFDFADFASTQGKASTESDDFLNLIRRVRQDVTEASRLYTSSPVTDYLESWPDKKEWVDRILFDVQRTLNDIGVYVETVRVSGDESGTAALRRKFEWALSHLKKLSSKQQTLTACHSSLMAAVTMMQAVEMKAAFSGQDPVFEAPTRPWVKDHGLDVLRSPHSRQRWRLSQRNLSLPSITVSEAEGDKVERNSIGSTLAELPGSTPDDLPDSNNWDLYTLPKEPPKPSDDTAVHISPKPMHAKPSTEKEVTVPRPPSDPLPARRSFDHIRPSLSSIQDPPRASFDQTRPRAFSDHVLPSRSLELGPRASFDQVRPLPTVTEKPLERYDSNASVSIADASTVPLGGIRYRPRAVHVKKPPKHHSLPSKLPTVSSTSSLMDDLSNWIIPVSARESYQSYQSMATNVSLDPSSPATSVNSMPSPAGCSPTLNQLGSLTESPKPDASTISTANVSTEQKLLQKVDIRAIDLRPLPNGEASLERTRTMESCQVIPGEPVPISSPPGYPSKLYQEPPSPVTNSKADSSSSKPIISVQPTAHLPYRPPQPSYSHPEVLTKATVFKEQAPNLPPHPPKLPESTLGPNESDRVSNTPLTNAPVPESVSESSSHTSTQSPRNYHTVTRKPVPTPVTPAPPMTALAKRRAAHARRMQRAFEAE